jgi:hypothetical protein
VLDPGVPQHVAALSSAVGVDASADWDGAVARVRAGLEHAPKLAALRELLIDCGIAEEAGEGVGGWTWARICIC